MAEGHQSSLWLAETAFLKYQRGYSRQRMPQVLGTKDHSFEEKQGWETGLLYKRQLSSSKVLLQYVIYYLSWGIYQLLGTANVR